MSKIDTQAEWLIPEESPPLEQSPGFSHTLNSVTGKRVFNCVCSADIMFAKFVSSTL